MKNLFILLLLSLATSLVTAQEYTIYQQGSDYYLRSVVTVENGTNTDDTVRTVQYLGDSSQLLNSVRNLDIRNINQAVRKIKAYNDLDQQKRDNSLRSAALSFGINLDSLNDLNYANQFLDDSVRLVVFTNRIDTADLSLWTSDPNPPNRLVKKASIERRPNGNIRMYLDVNFGNTRLRLDGPRYFRISNLPGSEAFYLDSETERFKIWRTANIGRPHILMFVKK